MVTTAMSTRTLLIGASLSLLLACGSSARNNVGPGSGADGGGPGPGDLQVLPATATLTVEGGVAAHQAYTVALVNGDGTLKDVTAEAQLTLDLGNLGTFSGADLTTATDHGGHTTVRAAWQGHAGTADLKVLLKQTIIDPSLPTTTPGSFGTATAGGPAPSLVYPETGVLVPDNLGTLEFHFMPGAGQNVFELTFEGSQIQLVLYVPCTTLGAGCVWSPTPAQWSVLATAGRGDQPLTYTLRGLDSVGVVGASASRTIQFSADDLLGGLYYWNAKLGQVMRYDFGLANQAAEKFLAVNQTTGVTCVGCHVLSRDGTRLAVGLDIPGPASVEIYDVATRAKQWTGAGFVGGAGANFDSFSPDNSKLVSSTGANLELRSAVDGTGMTTMVKNATMPDWSPDGDHVVFSRPAKPLFIPVANPGVAQGSIVEVDAATWHNETVLVQSAGPTENNYYPAYSPDGNWVVFNRTANADSYDQPDAKVMLVARTGGAVIPLKNASPTGGDSWPKWSPLPHTYASGTVFWLTFSSRRAYGLRGVGNAQLWMVGIDTGRIAAGLDPSFASFWLPFQDPASGNHIAQWVEKIERQPCNPAPCMAGEFCVQGQCLPNPN
jgi:hypothetical protein